MTDDLRNLFAYHRWADERCLDACHRLAPGLYEEPEPYEVGWPSIRSVVVHLAWGNDAWIRRFLRQPPVPIPKETELPTLDEAERLLIACHDRFAAEVLPGFSAEQIASPFTYINYQGREITAPLWAALWHVVNHGTYHRGQIASKLKRRGVDPPTTDLVYWSIEGPTPS